MGKWGTVLFFPHVIGNLPQAGLIKKGKFEPKRTTRRKQENRTAPAVRTVHVVNESRLYIFSLNKFV